MACAAREHGAPCELPESDPVRGLQPAENVIEAGGTRTVQRAPIPGASLDQECGSQKQGLTHVSRHQSAQRKPPDPLLCIPASAALHLLPPLPRHPAAEPRRVQCPAPQASLSRSMRRSGTRLHYRVGVRGKETGTTSSGHSRQDEDDFRIDAPIRRSCSFKNRQEIIRHVSRSYFIHIYPTYVHLYLIILFNYHFSYFSKKHF